MSEEQARAEQDEASRAAAPAAEDEDEGPPSTPFDSPYFLPVILWGFTLYFGYDGWFNPEMEWVKFNRYGFGLGVGMSLYYSATAFQRRPWALPAMWAAFALWFGYMAFVAEGWWSDSPEAIYFNQIGCAVSAAMAAFCGLRSWLRERRAAGADPGAARG